MPLPVKHFFFWLFSRILEAIWSNVPWFNTPNTKNGRLLKSQQINIQIFWAYKISPFEFLMYNISDVINVWILSFFECASSHFKNNLKSSLSVSRKNYLLSQFLFFQRCWKFSVSKARHSRGPISATRISRMRIDNGATNTGQWYEYFGWTRG